MNIKLADRVQQVEEYYFSKKLSEIADMRLRGIDVINLGIGSPDLKPANIVINQLALQAQESDLHGYQSYRGIPEYRVAIADWYKSKFNVELDAVSQVLPLIGSKEGIMHISMTYLQDGDQVLIPNPGYPTYRSASLLTGADVMTYNLSGAQGWQPDFEALEQQDLSRVKIMWLNYPHMPTGTPADRSVMEKLVAFAHRHNILLCHDNPYAFILNDHPASLLQIAGALDVTIELNSLSKTYNMAGWR
ncbi:UNVERIFIED_CONTAM: hypothetical protein GTU68_064101, partial [Idotea baltica]|nr:hypothetical protein [Idotea baltica]